MILKNNEKSDGIFLIISSFNHIYNFLSFFIKKKFIIKKKIYLLIISDFIPLELVSKFKIFLEQYTEVEIIDLRRRVLKPKLKIFKIIYYIKIFEKVLKIKKKVNIEFICTYSRLQYPILLIFYTFPFSKIFFLEDGIGEYIINKKKDKKLLINIFLKKFFEKNKKRIFILQLSKNIKDYKRTLNHKFFNKENYLENKINYKSFIKKILMENYYLVQNV